MKHYIISAAVAASMLFTSCATASKTAVVSQTVVKPGVEVLRDRGFAELQGKRVGLLTNPSGVDRNLVSTIEILNENVNLVALYAPEHGVRGDVWAGGKVASSKDETTGLPVYSLYGKTRKASAEMMEGIDVMVYDIQDVGSRSYTFISSLGLLMRTCAELDIPVVILDRPNPLGGNKVEGSYVHPGFYSFVSQFKIPYVYGLTVGELMTLINEEGLNVGEKGDQEPLKCKLTVIPMEGWHRDMTYKDTNLPWILPSPNIPYPDNAIGYPCSGLCGEFDNYLNIGVGYTLPFHTFAAEWIDADQLKARLDSYKVPGIAWRTIHYTPFWGGSAKTLLHGVQYVITDYDAVALTLTQFYVMQAVYELYGKNPFEMSPKRCRMFDLVCGTDFVRESLGKDFKVESILPYWNADAAAFKELSRKYYLYQ